MSRLEDLVAKLSARREAIRKALCGVPERNHRANHRV